MRWGFLRGRRLGFWALTVGAIPLAMAAEPTPVSFHRDLAPIFRRSCEACHQPAKMKGGLDLSSATGAQRGGKHPPLWIPRDPAGSRLVTQVKGADAAMPPEGERLSDGEVALLERWIQEGALIDAPASPALSNAPPPRYVGRPVITALAYSPDGSVLAVAGGSEVHLFEAQDFSRRDRWRGTAPRLEALQYSPDGHWLVAVGGQASRSGEIQFWETATGQLRRTVTAGGDSWLSVDWSPDAARVVVAGADKTVRIFQREDGREVFRFDQHSDWVFGACFVDDGRRVVTAGRDRTMKLLDAETGRLIDEICRPNEPLLGVRRHPQTNFVANLGAEARVRVFKAQAKPNNDDPNADPNFVREYEHFDGGMTAAAYSPDGRWFATAGGSAGEVRVQDSVSGGRKAVLRGHDGAVFTLAFSPDGHVLATGGFEGLIRIFEWETDRLRAVFSPVSSE